MERGGEARGGEPCTWCGPQGPGGPPCCFAFAFGCGELLFRCFAFERSVGPLSNAQIPRAEATIQVEFSLCATGHGGLPAIALSLSAAVNCCFAVSLSKDQSVRCRTPRSRGQKRRSKSSFLPSSWLLVDHPPWSRPRGASGSGVDRSGLEVPPDNPPVRSATCVN